MLRRVLQTYLFLGFFVSENLCFSIRFQLFDFLVLVFEILMQFLQTSIQLVTVVIVFFEMSNEQLH